MGIQKVLAIDYGTQRVGVALSFGTLAEPLLILENTPQLIAEIQDIIQEHQVNQLVIGISENEMAEKTQQFVTQLRQVTSLPIELADETLTSATVHQKMAERAGKKQTPRGHIDHYAAAEILQEWLDLHS